MENAHAASAPRIVKAKGAAGLAGALWFGGWLFTVGFLHLAWWKILLGLIAWPYFLGSSFHG
jgi:hypothetical protein